MYKRQDHQLLNFSEEEKSIIHSYDLDIKVAYNFFTSPYKSKPTKGVRYKVFLDTLPSDLLQSYLEQTTIHSLGVDPVMLMQIMSVFSQSTAKLKWFCAFDESDRLIGSFLAVINSSCALVVLGWVDKLWRNQGIMGSLFSELTKQELGLSLIHI